MAPRLDPTLAKLNFKAHRRALVLDAPGEAGSLLAALVATAEVSTGARARGPFDFALVFLRARRDVVRAARAIALLGEDAVFWCAYPKQSSRRYASDLSRDVGWQPLGDLGFEPVRQVALDADWSALRFRRAEHIGTMIRDPASALSKAGKRKAGAATDARSRGPSGRKP